MKTTGVYCRPSCAARLPLRKNVAFHDTTEAARLAGFRPCKRCRPDDAHRDTAQRKRIEAACRTIDAACQTPRLADLADAAGLSPQYFHRETNVARCLACGASAIPCPRCDDGHLSERSGPYGRFFGCSNYPACRFTRNQ